jgi:hypothetical protein
MDEVRVGIAELPNRFIWPIEHATALAQWCLNYCNIRGVTDVGHTWSVQEVATVQPPGLPDVTEPSVADVLYDTARRLDSLRIGIEGAAQQPEATPPDDPYADLPDPDPKAELYAYSQELLQAHPYTRVLNRIWDELIAIRVQVGYLMELISGHTKNRTAVPDLDQANELLKSMKIYFQNTLAAHAFNMQHLHSALGRLTCEESYMLGLALTPLGDPAEMRARELNLIADAETDDADDAAEGDDDETDYDGEDHSQF